MKENIREISIERLHEWLLSVGEKKFREKQITEWLWKKNVSSFEEMKNLSKELKNELSSSFSFPSTKIENELQSVDKTIKFIFNLHDDLKIEGVLIFHGDRSTACVSSQVGCPLQCEFCATGKMGFHRNLDFWEIIDQYALINKKSLEYFGFPIGNIVFMGMGEPLLNYKNVKRAIETLTDPSKNGLSPQRITLSTVGIPEGIKQLAVDGLRVHLALSLHSASDAIRSEIMPINIKYPLPILTNALRYYNTTTQQRITIEYLLLNGINDHIEDAEKLASFCKSFPVKVNIIDYNATEGIFMKCSAAKKQSFVERLASKNMIVNVRQSKGEDIAAACGQLVKKHNKKD